MSIEEFDSWLRSHFSYRPESQEVLREPIRMITDYENNGYVEGDCDCASIFAAFVVSSCGCPCRFVAIRYSKPVEFEHVFVEAPASGEVFAIDPTVRVGTRYAELERMVLDVS